jgi:hypothetical protein
MDEPGKGNPLLAEELQREPRLAIREHDIVCLICGGAFQRLTNTHLRSHRTNALDYKQRFGYHPDRALMSTALLRQLATRVTRD